MREMIYLGSQVVIHWNATADKMLLNQNQKKSSFTLQYHMQLQGVNLISSTDNT